MAGNTRTLTAGTDQLRTIAAKMSSIGTDFFKEYEAIYSLYDNELSEAWVGSGIDAFKQNVETIKPNFKKLYDLINDYSSQLVSAADAYDSQESDIKAATSNITFE